MSYWIGLVIPIGKHVGGSQLKADAGEKGVPSSIAHSTFVISSQVSPSTQQTGNGVGVGVGGGVGVGVGGG